MEENTTMGTTEMTTETNEDFGVTEYQIVPEQPSKFGKMMKVGGIATMTVGGLALGYKLLEKHFRKKFDRERSVANENQEYDEEEFIDGDYEEISEDENQEETK